MEWQLRDTTLGGGLGPSPRQPATSGGAGGIEAFLRAYDNPTSAPALTEGRAIDAPPRRIGDGVRHPSNDPAARRQDEAVKHTRRREAESPTDISACAPAPTPLAKPVRASAGDDDAALVEEGRLRGGSDAAGHGDGSCSALGQGTPEGGEAAASPTVDTPDGGAKPAGGAAVEEIGAELHDSQPAADLFKANQPPDDSAPGDEIDVAAALEAEGRAAAKGAGPLLAGEDAGPEVAEPGWADDGDPAEPSMTAGMAKAGRREGKGDLRPDPGAAFEARSGEQRSAPANTEQMGTEPLAPPSSAPLATALIPAAFAPGAGALGDSGRDLPGAASRIAEQLAAAVAVRPEGVDVTLRPEELGHVRISIERRGAEVAVTVVADRGETVELMRRHADLLAAEFRAAGFENCSFHFGQQRGGQAPGRGGESVSDSKAESTAGPPGNLPAAIEAAATQAGAGLDLRV